MKTRRTIMLIFLAIILLNAYWVGSWWYGKRYQRWVFESNYLSFNPASICSDGTVVVGTHDTLVALDPANGRVRWQFPFPEANEHPNSRIEVGPHDILYVGSDVQGDLHKLYAIDGTTGKALWSNPEEVAELAVGPGDCMLVGHKRLLALDGRTGHKIWDFQPPLPSGQSPTGVVDRSQDGHIQSIAYSNGIVLVAFCDPYKRLFALNAATGKVKWSLQTSADVNSLPVTQNGLVAVGGHDGVEAFEVATGQPRWHHDIDKCDFMDLNFSDGVVYASAPFPSRVYALNEADGSLKWMRELEEDCRTAPVSGAHGILYQGADRNRMLALDRADGKVQWDLSFGSLWSHLSELGSSTLVSTSKDGMVYVLSSDDHLYALKPP